MGQRLAAQTDGLVHHGNQNATIPIAIPQAAGTVSFWYRPVTFTLSDGLPHFFFVVDARDGLVQFGVYAASNTLCAEWTFAGGSTPDLSVSTSASVVTSSFIASGWN